MRKRGMPSPDRARTAAQALSRRGQAAAIDIASNHAQSVTGDLTRKPADVAVLVSSARGLGLPKGLLVRRFVVQFIAVVAFVLAPWPATAAPPDNFPDQIDLSNG
jgi:hypothetical protein